MNFLIRLCIFSRIGSYTVMLGQELQSPQPAVSFETLENGNTNLTILSDYIFTYPYPLSGNFTFYIPGDEIGIFMNDRHADKKSDTSSIFIDDLTHLDTNNGSPTPKVNSESSQNAEIVEDVSPAHDQFSRVKKETSDETGNGGGILVYDETGNSDGEDENDASESEEDKVHIVRCFSSWRDTPENLRNFQLDLKGLRKGEMWFHRTQLKLIPLSESESTEEVEFEVADVDEVKQLIEAQLKKEAEAMTKVLDLNKKASTEDTTDQRRQTLLFTKGSLETQLCLFEEYLDSDCINADELDVRTSRIVPLLDEYFHVIQELISLPTPISPETITKFEHRYYSLLASAKYLTNQDAPNPTTENNPDCAQPLTTCEIEISPDECRNFEAVPCSPSAFHSCTCKVWRIPSEFDELPDDSVLPCNITQGYSDLDECSGRTGSEDPFKCLLAARNKCPAIKSKSCSIGSTTPNAKISTCFNRNGNNLLFKSNKILNFPTSQRVILDRRMRLRQPLLKSGNLKMDSSDDDA